MKGEKKIKVTYSTTNEKTIEEVIANLITAHENKNDEQDIKKVANR